VSTIRELLNERPELKPAADILIRTGAHADDVVRALMALPGSAGVTVNTVERPVVAISAPRVAERRAVVHATADPVAMCAAARAARSREITALWDKAMAKAMAHLPQRASSVTAGEPHQRTIAARWDDAMSRAMGQQLRRAS
jgi:hypothetical protein